MLIGVYEMGGNDFDNFEFINMGKCYVLFFVEKFVDDIIGLVVVLVIIELFCNECKYGVWGYNVNDVG